MLRRKVNLGKTIPSWCDTIQSLFFSAPNDPQLTIFIMTAFYCHTEEALLPVPQVDSGVLVISTREMGDVRHAHYGGIPFIWNSILHKMTDLHLRPTRGRSRTHWDQGQTKAGIAYISTASSTFPLTVSCSKLFLTNASRVVTS